MRVIFVDKEKEQVVKKCNCNTENIEKYLKIDDFTYKKVVASGSPKNEQMLYGFDADLTRLSATDGYVVCIPGHGKFYWEFINILTIVRGYEYLFFKMGQKSSLKIPDDALVIISRRGKL